MASLQQTSYPMAMAESLGPSHTEHSTPEEAYKELADFFAAPAPETLDHVAGIRGIEANTTLRERSMAFAESLRTDTHALREQIVAESGDTPSARLIETLAQIDRGDPRGYEAVGLQTSPRHFYDIASVMARGLPLEWEVAELGYDSRSPELLPSSVAIMSALNNLNRLTPVYRPVIMLCDTFNPMTGTDPSVTERDRFTVATVHTLAMQGLVSTQHTPGVDFLVKRTSDSVLDLYRLAADQPSFFRSDVTLQSVFADLQLHKLPTEIAGLDYAATIAGYTNPINAYFTHVSRGAPFEPLGARDVREALRKCELTLPEDTHALTYAHPFYFLPWITQAYATLKLLESQMRLYATHKATFSSFGKLHAGRYAQHSFGTEVEDKSEDDILPEDYEILVKLDAWFEQRFAPGEITDDVLNIGAGSNPYLAQVAAAYMDKRLATLYSYEPAPDARGYLSSYKAGALPPDLARIAPKFARRLLQIGGERYADCDERARNAILVDYGTIYRLPKKRFKVILEGFVAGSIAKEESLYTKAMRSMQEALLDDESVIISLDMLESAEGWETGVDEHGEPIRFPSAYVTLDLIARSREDAGLKSIVIPINPGGRKLREGYKGMALSIAWPATASPEIDARNRRFAQEAWRQATNGSLSVAIRS